MLAAVVAANPALANPTTQATATATGGGATGGNLPAGNYFISYTFTDGAGETTVGTSRTTALTVGATNIPRVTVPALPTGANGINLYVTAAGGTAGTETLYATGITTTTFDLSFAAPTEAGIAIPTANTSGAANILGRINAGVAGNAALQWTRLSDLISNYIRGLAVSFQSDRVLIGHIDYCFALWKQVAKEVLTLIAANPGTLKFAPGATVPKPYRAVGSIT